jgi:Protein of unknown function (DUF3124)
MKRRSIALAPLMIVASLACDAPAPTGGPASKPGAARPGVSEVALPSDDRILFGQTIYVPIYSHVYTADNAQPLNLSATLFVRNADRAGSIILTKVQYVDSSGKAVRDYLKSPLKIGPLASMDFFLKESDESGGASPSFIVEWVTDQQPRDPIVESVMIGTAGTQGISFTCSGSVIAIRKH